MIMTYTIILVSIKAKLFMKSKNIQEKRENSRLEDRRKRKVLNLNKKPILKFKGKTRSHSLKE